MNRALALPIITALLALALLRSAPASAETLTCTDVTSLPLIISTPGHYCLNRNFTQSFSSAAININASQVVLDCNNHFVINTSTALGTSGVYVSNKNLVTVRNCELQNFTRGIAFFESAAGASRNNRVEHNDVQKAKLAGIQIAGSNNIIDGNRVTENQGYTSSYTYGILVSSFDVQGVGNVVQNNAISDIAPSVYVRVIGIYLLDVQNTTVKDNTISALYPPLDLGVYGIVGSSTVLGTAVVDNTILSATGSPSAGGGGISYGGANYDGVRFDSATSTGNHNVCRGNVVGHFLSNINMETPTSGCVKDSNTEF
jgi:parallel beta-helix repeat protein